MPRLWLPPIGSTSRSGRTLIDSTASRPRVATSGISFARDHAQARLCPHRQSCAVRDSRASAPHRGSVLYFIQLKTASLVFDFADFPRRNALPLSFVAVKTLVANNDARLTSWYKPTEEVEKGIQPYVPVSFNQLDCADQNVPNLNEWNDACKNFLADPTTGEKYHFFALTQNPLGPSTMDAIGKVMKHAEGKGSEIALCDPLIFASWKPCNPESYTNFSGTTIPADRPLVVDNVQAVVPNQQQAIIVFAVKRQSPPSKKHANMPAITARRRR